MPATPRAAATVMLIRDSDRKEIEVLMVQRSLESDFCPGVYVFPGGALEPSDYAPGVEELCSGMDRAQARSIIRDAGADGQALGLFVAGIREVFEEVRLLLAYHAGGRTLAFSGEGETRFSDHRRRLAQGDLSFTQMVQREGLTLAVDRLAYFAHFITPPASPIRFSTRFFVAAAPPGQTPEHDARETTGSCWISPKAALAGSAGGQFPLIRPTIVNLQTLAAFSSCDEVLAHARSRDVAVTTLNAGPA